MLCERAQELFSDYLEGAVGPAMLVPLEGHLGQCDACRVMLEGMRKVWSTLDHAPLIEPPAAFRDIVWAKIDALESDRALREKPRFALDWRSLFRPAALGWAAAAFAIVMLAPVVIPGTRSTASLWFPWSLVYHSAPAATVAVSDPDVTIQDGKKWLIVRVENTGGAAAKLQVSIDGVSTPAVIEAPAASNRSYRICEAPEGTARIRVAWQENGVSHSEDLSISQ